MIGIPTDGTRTGQRRRGTALEAAILRAAWEELTSVGYAQVSMEGVAARAHTSKQVLYRRWRNRAELILAAIRHRMVSISENVPDTGDLRGDVLEVMHEMARRYQQIGPDVVHGLMAEVHDLRPDYLLIVEGVMRTILKRAADRGEIRLDAIPPRIATLPVDLLRHEMLLTNRELFDVVIAEIVDDIFLPLVCHQHRLSGRSRIDDL